MPAYVQALLEQTAENMENLQGILARGEEGRRESNTTILALSERIATITDSMRTNQQIMLKMAESQQALAPALQKLTEPRSGGGDDVTRAHLRNIEMYAQRLLAELEAGRTQSTSEIRNEIKILTRTIAAISEEQQR